MVLNSHCNFSSSFHICSRSQTLAEIDISLPDDVATEEGNSGVTKVGNIGDQLKDTKIKLDTALDETPVLEPAQEPMGTQEIREPETEIKIGEEDVAPVSAACSVYSNVKLENSPRITSGPAQCKIKIFAFKKVLFFFMIVY
jgi:hypothetical protein